MIILHLPRNQIIRITKICSVLILLCLNSVQAQINHPFLITRQSEFDSLREKSNQYPWNKLKEDALQRAAKDWEFEPGKSEMNNARNAINLASYLGTYALAYILDPDNKNHYAKQVKKSIIQDLNKIKFDEFMKHRGVVRPANTLFIAILSLDIVYNSLSDEEIADCEQTIMAKIAHINREGPWVLARHGLYGTWEIYKGIRTTPDVNYYEDLMTQITGDGVTTVAGTYAFARLGTGDDRSVKTGYMDVLEHTGIDNRYYNNPKLEKFYEWLFSLAVTPFHWRTLIGDTHPFRGYVGPSSLFLRATNINPGADQYLHWFLQGSLPDGNILSYIIPKKALTKESKVPSSKVYKDGGGWFREAPDDPKSLMGVLYNIDGDAEWHTHKETNGIFLAGYENYLTVNSGWLGITEAYKQNALTLNGEDHDAKIGDGLSEGLTSSGLDYACGLDGPALDSSTHKRNFFLVHGGEDYNGYYFMVDQVNTHPSHEITSYLHPATESPLREINKNEEYEATIDHHNRTEGVKLNLFYATPPESIQTEERESGYLQRVPDAGHHKSIEATYPVGSDGKKSIVTVLFPHNEQHQKATISRIEASNYSGAEITHSSNTRDIILSAPLGEEVNHGAITFEGVIAFSREQENKNHLFFVKKGHSFQQMDKGFSSQSPVSLIMDEKTGKINSEGAVIIFNYPDIRGVKLNGVGQEAIEKEKGQIKIWVPDGQHKIELITD